MRWELRGNTQQNAIIQEALDRCDFPFETFGEDRTIPVEWADLSRYRAAPVGGTSTLEAHVAGGAHEDHTHDGEFDVLEFREQVLGLAWYSGKVTIEQSLVNRRDLAMEVFLSEGAHMVDFFGMTDEHRVAVWNSVHPAHQHLTPGTDIADGMDLGHGHSWFDVGGYYSWVGEAFMGLFVRAFSNLPVTIGFDHSVTTRAAELVREAFLGADEPEPTPEPEPEPEPEGSPVFASKSNRIFHDKHGRIKQVYTYTSREAAERAGLRACKVCKPA